MDNTNATLPATDNTNTTHPATDNTNATHPAMDNTNATHPAMDNTNATHPSDNSETPRRVKRKFVTSEFQCERCSKCFTYPRALLNHKYERCKNELLNGRQQLDADQEPNSKRLKLVELKIKTIQTTVDLILIFSAARLAENQDCDLNINRKDRLIMYGSDYLKQEKNLKGSIIWVCDEAKVIELVQQVSTALSEKLLLKFARLLKKNTCQSPIEICLESPEQATLFKHYFQKSASNISVCSYLTMATQVRKSILNALEKLLNSNKDFQAAFLSQHDHKPEINIRMSADDDFNKYSFTDAMSVYENTLKKRDDLLAEAYQLAKNTHGIKWEEIFIVLKYKKDA